MSASAPAAVRSPAKRSNAYDLFIFVLTILSFVILGGLVLPRVSPPTKMLLNAYDNIICVVFLFDFGLRMRRAPRKRDYFFGERGWLDLLGSIPSFGYVGSGKYIALFRLCRISRLIRIIRMLRRQGLRSVIQDVLENRSEYAVFITLLAGMIVLVLSSVLALQFESKNPSANIQSGGESLWWAIVTLTTVGYGDYFPITPGGRITGVFVMITGIGIIGALASIFASLLVSGPQAKQQDPLPPDVPTGIAEELRALRNEIAALRDQLADRGKSSS